MSFGKDFSVAVGAGQTGIRIDTDELPDAIATISAECRKHAWRLEIWDRHAGLVTATAGVEFRKEDHDDFKLSSKKPQPPKSAQSALATVSPLLASLKTAAAGGGSDAGEPALGVLKDFIKRPPQPGETPDDPTPVILVFKNFQRTFERTPEEMIATVQTLLDEGKEDAKFVVALMSPEAKLPPEIEPLFSTITHAIPDESELDEILGGIVSSGASGTEPDPEERRQIVRAALGLTRLQAEGVYATSMVVNKRVVAKDVWLRKAKILNKEGLVELHESPMNFANVGGLHGAKDFLKRLCAHDPLEDFDSDARAKGVCLVGAPGCLHGGTRVFDPVADTNFTVAERYAAGEAFNVLAVSAEDGRVVVAAAEPPHVYPVSEMVEVVFKSGRRIRVTRGHRFWDGEGFVTADEVASRLHSGERVLLPTTADTGR